MALIKGTGRIQAGPQVRLYDLEFQNSGVDVVDDLVVVDRCQFTSGSPNIDLAGDQFTARNCVALTGSYFVLITGSGVVEVTIEDNYALNPIELNDATIFNVSNNILTGVRAQDPRSGVISDNTFGTSDDTINEAAIEVGGAYGMGGTADDGCIISGNRVSASFNAGIYAVGSPAVTISGNIVTEAPVGMWVDGCDGVVVTGNQIFNSETDGLKVDNTNQGTFVGNKIEGSSSFSVNVSDQVVITASDFNLVEGNTLRVGANTPRYGVNVVSGECNMVVGNNLGDPNDYGTDALADTGSNTQLTYPGSMTYGDNFTDCGTGS